MIDPSVKQTLEALIPAIKDIESGWYEYIEYFEQLANERLAELGSPYRYVSTSILTGPEGWEGDYVDNMSVVNVLSKADLEEMVPELMQYEGGCFDCVKEYVDQKNYWLRDEGVPFRLVAVLSDKPEPNNWVIDGTPHGRLIETIKVVDIEEYERIQDEE